MKRKECRGQGKGQHKETGARSIKPTPQQSYKHRETLLGAAVAYWLARRIRDRNEEFEREFDSPLMHTLSKVQDAQ